MTERRACRMSPPDKVFGMLDGGSFAPHLEYAAAKAWRMAMALARFLPNLGRPRELVRRLYSGVVHSVFLYGATMWYADPFWAGTLRCWLLIMRELEPSLPKRLSGGGSFSLLARDPVGSGGCARDGPARPSNESCGSPLKLSSKDMREEGHWDE